MIHKLSNIHFTSNLHFRNKEIALSRGFKDVEEMEDSIIEKWNKQVKPDDIIYILGDFCSIVKGALQSYMNLVYELHGQKHFVLSSNDYIETFTQMMEDPNLGILSVSQYKEVMFMKQRVVLMHYPILKWAGMDGIRGSIHLHGGTVESNLSIKRINISFDQEGIIYTAEDIFKQITQNNKKD